MTIIENVSIKFQKNIKVKKKKTGREHRIFGKILFLRDRINMSPVNERIHDIISRVVQNKPIEKGDLGFVNHIGENAFFVHMNDLFRKNSNTSAVFKDMNVFMRRGFDVYAPNDRGVSVFHLLLANLSGGHTPKDDRYLGEIKKIVDTSHPPPRWRGVHPLLYLFRMIERLARYGRDGRITNKSTALWSAIRLMTRFTPYIDQENMFLCVAESIIKRFYEFLDALFDTDEKLYPLFSKTLAHQMLHVLLEERQALTQIDEKDDHIVGIMSGHASNIHTLAEYALDNGDIRAFHIMFPMIRSKTRRSLLLERYILRNHDCRVDNQEFLLSALQDKIKIRTPFVLHQLIHNNCVDILRVLYSYGTLSRRMVRNALDDVSPSVHNDALQFLSDIVLRHTLIDTLAQTSHVSRSPQNEKTTHKLSKISRRVKKMNPDTLRQLSRYLL